MMYFDLFFDALPKREVGLDDESIYAIVEVNTPLGTVYHAQVTQGQYLSMTKADRALLKVSSKARDKVMRNIKKSNGYYSAAPMHTFNDGVTDLYDRKKYSVMHSNTLITADEKSAMLAVKEVLDAKTIEIR